MSYERDEAMRQQEATEAMIRMRDPDRRAGGLHPDPLADRGEIERLREALEKISEIAWQDDYHGLERCGDIGRLADAALSTPPAAERGEWTREPTEAQYIAARDWSKARIGTPIGNDAARGCWQAMWDAPPSPRTPEGQI